MDGGEKGCDGARVVFQLPEEAQIVETEGVEGVVLETPQQLELDRIAERSQRLRFEDSA